MPSGAMTKETCNKITEAVQAIARSRPLDRTASQETATRSSGSPPFTESLISYFEEELYVELSRRFPTIEPTSMSIIALMAFLGPRFSSPLPLSLYRDLKRRIDTIIRNRTLSLRRRLDFAVQCALAYGCRWNRRTSAGDSVWDTAWPGAVTELVGIAYNFTIQATVALARSVRGFQHPPDHLLESYASIMVAHFIAQKRPAQHAYQLFQRLENWDPAKGNLYAWIQRAIQGSPKEADTFLANRFRHGLLYPLLKEDQGLDVGRLAFRSCLECGTLSEYDPASTRRCKCGRSARRSRIVSVVLLYIRGLYSEMPFRRCKGSCAPGYHEGSARECPHDGAALSTRPSRLLVRASLLS